MVLQVAPVAVSDAAMLAPEEIFHGKGNIKEEAELTKEERKRRRANQKRRFRRLKGILYCLYLWFCLFSCLSTICAKWSKKVAANFLFRCHPLVGLLQVRVSVHNLIAGDRHDQSLRMT